MSNYHIDPIEHVPFVMSDVHTFDLKIFVMSDVHTFDLKLLVVLLSFGSLAQQFFRIPPSSPSPPVFAALFHMALVPLFRDQSLQAVLQPLFGGRSPPSDCK
jgi:hypothetical protein